MAYEVTATRKRPQTLAQIIDQEFVAATLKSSIEQGRIAHAYLFSGPRGVGKTSAARILAKSLNCEHGPTATPCGQCSLCTEISGGSSLDVIEIDGASNTGVNDVREIKEEVLFAPNTCRYKVYIIDEVHMLSNSAFNALLKTIEEPPPYIVFIFATTEIHKVPATIRSRCQQFNFKLISIAKIREKLEQVTNEMGIKAEEQALFWIAKEATGSMRDAYTLFDQIVSFSDGEITLEKIKEKLGVVGIDELNEIISCLAAGTTREALLQTEKILSKGIAVEQFVIELVEYFRNILFIKHDIKKDHILGYPVESFPENIITAYTIPQVELTIEMLLGLYRNLRFTVNPQFELELVISRMAYLKEMITQQEILSKISTLRKELSTPGAISSVPTETPEPPAGENPENQNSEPTETDLSSSATMTNTPPANEGEVPQNLIQEIIRLLHKNKKLTLASSLEKIESWKCEDNRLILTFGLQDKFSGELIKREKKIILETTSSLVARNMVLEVKFNNQKEEDCDMKDNRVEILKEIFDGEIIKGE